MGLFGKRIDEKNATKTTYSEDDLKKLDLNYSREFSEQKDYCIYSPFRKETPRAWLAQIRDLAFEKILDDHMYTFKHLLVIPNPYGVSVQTALLLFNTSKECRVRYRILGKTEGTDFCGETEPGTRHRVSVMGLYQGYTNKLKLELVDENDEVIRRRDLTIYARDIPLNQQNIVTKVEHKELSQFPFILINGLHFNPIVLDQNGEVRYSLQLRTNKLGMIPLQNGHVLYADTTASRVGPDGNVNSCQYHEMDYMGRIYRTFLLEYPIEGIIAQQDDSMFLVTSSDKKWEGDCIVEMELSSGQIKRRCVLADILGTKYQNRKIWTPVTGLEYSQGRMIICLRRFHTVLSLDWESQSVQWVLAPEAVWRDTPLEKYLLTGADAGHDQVIGYLPEQMEVRREEDGCLVLGMYCIQNKGTALVEGIENSDDSRIVRYRIDEKNQCFSLERSIEVVKSKRFGSCRYDEESGRMLSVSGALARQSENLRGCIEELDGDTGTMINRLRLCKRFSRAWLFEPDIGAYSRPLDKDLKVIHGQLDPPEVFEGTLPIPCGEKLKKKVFGNIRVSQNLFLFAFYPGTVSRVYLIGEKYSYVQDYSQLKLKRRKESFAIALDQLQYDEYQVYVEYDGNVYQLKNEIRIEGVKK